MQYIERAEELNSEEVEKLLKSGYIKISGYEDILFDSAHWAIPQHNQAYNYMFEGVALISLTPEAKELATSEGYEKSKYAISNTIIENSLLDGIYSQGEIESEFGGSFIDDILSEIGYPPEEHLVWKIDNNHVYVMHNNIMWSRSPNFDGNVGEYLEEWVLTKD